MSDRSVAPWLVLLRRAWPLLLVLALGAAIYVSGLHRELSCQALCARQAELGAFVATRPALAAGCYLLIYIVSIALSLPTALWLTIAGGLLFGTLAGGTLAVLGATIGAVLLFLAARSALRPLLAARSGGMLERVRPGLERDGFSYLLALRLIPVVPFWLTNLAPALVGMRLAPYVAATLLGVIPGTFVFASVGAGIGGVLAAGGAPDAGVIFSAPILLPLLGLAALSLLPVAWRKWRRAPAR